MLTPSEFGKFVHLQLSLWNHYENMFYQHENDFLDEALFEASGDTVRRYSRLWIAMWRPVETFAATGHQSGSLI